MAISQNTPVLPTGHPMMSVADGAFQPAFNPQAALKEDVYLISLWKRALATAGERVKNERRQAAAVASLPAWARWGGRMPTGVAIHEPEWTDAMLAEHAIPQKDGRRITRRQIDAINRACVEAEIGRPVENHDPAYAAGFAAGLADGHLAGLGPSTPGMLAVHAANARRSAAYEARVSQQREEEERVGLFALQAECDRIDARMLGILADIAAAKAQGFAGALIKLRSWRYWEHSDLARDPQRMAVHECCALEALEVLERMLPPALAAEIPAIATTKEPRRAR